MATIAYGNSSRKLLPETWTFCATMPISFAFFASFQFCTVFIFAKNIRADLAGLMAAASG